MPKVRRQIGVGGFKVSPQAVKYVLDVLKNHRLSYGYYLSEFEKQFARLHDIKYAIFVNSGTSALQISLHALKEKYGWRNSDEILVPAITFPATVNIVLKNNLKPVFVDVDAKFYDIDPEKIEEKISKKTRAIIPVHVGGHPANMGKIVKIAKKYNLKILEDSCETMFATSDGKPVGSFGDVAAFSTYAAHIIVTGVGGFATTNDNELALLIKSLANHGRDEIYISMDDDKTDNPQELFQIVSRRFNYVYPGYSYRGTELEGAIGLAQLEEKDEALEKRKKAAQILSEGLSPFEEFLQLPRAREGAEHVFMFYPILVKNPQIERDELVFFLEENLIETRFLLPLLNQPVYKKIFGNIEDDYPVAKYIAKNGFYIGCHPELTETDLDYIITIFKKFFKKYKLKSALKVATTTSKDQYVQTTTT